MLIFDPIIDPATGMRLTQSRFAQGWSRVDDLIAGYIADVKDCSGGLVTYQEVGRQIVDGFPLRESGRPQQRHALNVVAALLVCTRLKHRTLAAKPHSFGTQGTLIKLRRFAEEYSISLNAAQAR